MALDSRDNLSGIVFGGAERPGRDENKDQLALIFGSVSYRFGLCRNPVERDDAYIARSPTSILLLYQTDDES